MILIEGKEIINNWVSNDVKTILVGEHTVHRTALIRRNMIKAMKRSEEEKKEYYKLYSSRLVEELNHLSKGMRFSIPEYDGGDEKWQF